jgi:hypothetical protein
MKLIFKFFKNIMFVNTCFLITDNNHVIKQDTLNSVSKDIESPIINIKKKNIIYEGGKFIVILPFKILVFIVNLLFFIIKVIFNFLSIVKNIILIICIIVILLLLFLIYFAYKFFISSVSSDITDGKNINTKKFIQESFEKCKNFFGYISNTKESIKNNIMSFFKKVEEK